MDILILSQIFGYSAVALHIAQFLSVSQRHMLWFGLGSTGLLGIHFWFSGTHNGVLACVISIAVKLIALSNHEFLSKILLRISPLISAGYFWFFGEGLYDALPALALLFIMVADLQNDIVKMKTWYYGSALSWLTYGICIGSLPSISYDLLGLLFLTIGIFRVKRQRKLAF